MSATAGYAPPSRLSQMAGSILLLAAAFVGSILLPAVARSSLTASGHEVVTLPDGTSFTPASGWSRSSQRSGLAAVYERAGASFTVQSATDALVTPHEQLASFAASLEEASSAWRVGEPADFLSDDGLTGVVLTAHQLDEVFQRYVVSDGRRSVGASVWVPEAAWSGLQDQIAAMAQSISLPSGDAS